jgi:hypothetical protein
MAAIVRGCRGMLIALPHDSAPRGFCLGGTPPGGDGATRTRGRTTALPTSLFPMLAAAYARRTGDSEMVAGL